MPLVCALFLLVQWVRQELSSERVNPESTT